VAVNCAAIPETLIESELFGYEKGAFTGAASRRQGLFEAADRSTLFLDEIGELNVNMQAKVLRTLQEREIRRVGGREDLKVDVRIIAATNKDLEAEVKEGDFREDLYYRLNVIPLFIPPLRERKPDIAPLVEFLLERFAARGKGKATSVSPRTMAILMDHDWPGNVRELENVLEHAMVCSKGAVIEPEALPRSLWMGQAAPGGQAVAPREHPRAPVSPRALEKGTILRTLESSRWNRGLAAEHLGIDRTTLWRKMRRFGIRPPDN
jgi:transcriptional regulator with PAS, ATPase and Fis domain